MNINSDLAAKVSQAAAQVSVDAAKVSARLPRLQKKKLPSRWKISKLNQLK